jgi:iron-sulfur cluster assembly accessory protein
MTEEFTYVVTKESAERFLHAEDCCLGEAGVGLLPQDFVQKIFTAFPDLKDSHPDLVPKEPVFPITVTEAALKELSRVKAEQELGDDSVVRIGVGGGGCSGFQYNLGFDEFENYNEEADTLTEVDGVKIVVDKKSELFIHGTTLDWVEELNQRGFKFDNPNATRSCGCGSSFGC